MKRNRMAPYITLLVSAVLAGCSVHAPPRDNAQFTSQVLGLDVTWRYVNPGALNSEKRVAGHTLWVPGSRTCVIDIDPNVARGQLAMIAAHELGHCLQAFHMLPGISRPDLGDYFIDKREGYAQSYATWYNYKCGASLAPLGWNDKIQPNCSEPPDPREVYEKVPDNNSIFIN